MRVDSLEPVELGGLTQWIRVRGADPDLPVLLLMQQGPGLPIINEVRSYEKHLRLEKDFIVVYWDQRGTGLSACAAADITTARMVDDTVELLEVLRERFGRAAHIAGFSFGATYAAHAAARRPDLVASLILTGMDIDIPAAESAGLRFAWQSATASGNRRALRQLRRIGAPPHVTAKQFGTRARWVSNFGGVTVGATYNKIFRTTVSSLLRSPDYSIAAAVRAVRGILTSQSALLPELASTDLVRDLPRLEVPFVLAQGRFDQVAPAEAAQRFFDTVSGPSKQLVWFENSAHTPQYDQPEEFRALLLGATGRH